jgi:hypothetical protein
MTLSSSSVAPYKTLKIDMGGTQCAASATRASGTAVAVESALASTNGCYVHKTAVVSSFSNYHRVTASIDCDIPSKCATGTATSHVGAVGKCGISTASY